MKCIKEISPLLYQPVKQSKRRGTVRPFPSLICVAYRQRMLRRGAGAGQRVCGSRQKKKLVDGCQICTVRIERICCYFGYWPCYIHAIFGELRWPLLLALKP